MFLNFGSNSSKNYHTMFPTLNLIHEEFKAHVDFFNVYGVEAWPKDEGFKNPTI